jgi:1-acyl-sn-glycerol-3-phosphate acyltransferase
MSSWQRDLWYDFNYAIIFAGYTLGFSYRSDGSRHVPRRGPVLLLANHESFLDPLAVGLAVRRRLYFLARKSLFRPAWFGDYLRSVRCVPVDQEGVAKEGVRACVDLLAAGEALLVFPEGERTPTGEMLPFKPGIQLVLRRLKKDNVSVPIVPVGVAGAFEAYPRSDPLPKLSPMFWRPTGAAVAVSVGKAIPPEVYADLPPETMLHTLFDRVQAEVRQAEKIVRKKP